MDGIDVGVNFTRGPMQNTMRKFPRADDLALEKSPLARREAALIKGMLKHKHICVYFYLFRLTYLYNTSTSYEIAPKLWTAYSNSFSTAQLLWPHCLKKCEVSALIFERVVPRPF
ncbi:hypothetical protein, unlikely [Trypanosoma brucei brucei TREU927]|uniref:Uncharacterized protein n=1 Tax=Trypanosoma brucei brucei (strain 927/4 GUTat10.1) TaxID=185431 RepID=Q38CR8_TRYB2|nr:hypothetical protein, unlikely [Trypanosoma brucei brucei TREU927]EAN77402.1 hypothetical protein, unlikely [Trypanosoma brucei brucei TREU927]